MVRDFAGRPGEDHRALQRDLIYRHIAWLTALRYQLREERKWENMRQRHNQEYRRHYKVPEWEDDLVEQLRAVVPAEDMAPLLACRNRATHLIARQGTKLRAMAENGEITEFRQIELEKVLTGLYEYQGQCERIKNFPYPRQFATLNLLFVWLFVCLAPFGIMEEFQKMAGLCLGNDSGQRDCSLGIAHDGQDRRQFGEPVPGRTERCSDHGDEPDDRNRPAGDAGRARDSAGAAAGARHPDVGGNFFTCVASKHSSITRAKVLA